MYQTTIGHAMLYVRELERSVAFYTACLNLRVTEIVKEKFAFLTSGGPHHELALYAKGADAPTAPNGSVGLCHLAFNVPDKRSFAQAYRKLIDAKGATIIPGLIDSHVHMANLGFQIETFDFRNTKTVAEIAAKVRAAAQSRPKGEWIRGRSWDQTNWGGQFPTSAPLTDAAPANPVFLTRVDGHAGWANRMAMDLAKISRDTPDPPGGKIVHDEKGEPTGVLIDRAQGLVTRMIPASTDEQVTRRIASAAKECARLGLTSVHDAGAGEQEIAG